MNPNTHIYLYAKGHYVKTDIVKDLKKIIGKRCGIVHTCVSLENVLSILLNIAYDCLEKNGHMKHLFVEFMKNMYTTNLWKIGAKNTVCMEEIILYNCLSQIAMVEVIGLDLGEPDSNLLPLTKTLGE